MKDQIVELKISANLCELYALAWEMMTERALW